MARTESAHVKMAAVDEALLKRAAGRVGMSTPQYLLMAGLEKARATLGAEAVQIERRFGGGE